MRMSDAQRRAALSNLKVCPLCGCLNSRFNAECFGCGWHGRFDDDDEALGRGLEQLLQECPELHSALVEARTPRVPWWRRALAWRPWRRRLDVRL